MKYLKENWPIVVFCVILLIAACFIGFLINKDIQEEKAHKEWYNSLSAEEKAEYDAEMEEKRQANIYKYEVMNVSQYVRNRTNNFGGIVDTDICYTFSYLDGETLKQVDNFQNLEYGLTKVIIGDSNIYIVDKNNDNRYLQLTEETLKAVKIQK